MKRYQKSLLVKATYILALGLLCFFVGMYCTGCASVQDAEPEPSPFLYGFSESTNVYEALATTNAAYFSTNMYFASDTISLSNTISFSSALTISAGGDESVSFKWDEGRLDIERSEGATLTDSVEAFIKFLQRYMDDEYIIVNRKEYNFQMKRLQNWEKAAEQYRQIVKDQEKE